MYTAEETIRFEEWENISNFIAGFNVPATLLHSMSARLPELNKDTFSKAQMASKFWLVDTLKRYNIINNSRITICGGWYGALGAYIMSSGFPQHIQTVDRDPEATMIAKEFSRLNSCYNSLYEALCGDMLSHEYGQSDIIINTSFEHIENSTDWFKQIQRTNNKDPFIIIQSNNYDVIDDHVNCSQSLSELVENCGLSRIIYKGTMSFPIYDRYMVIGKL